jgi:hypothetical protein
MPEPVKMKPITQVEHVSGAEPAGICVRMKTRENEEITVYLDKDLVTRLRDLLQNALDNHLPPYPKVPKS